MELSPKEVQKSTKERMGRRREPAVDMSGEENTLTLQRPRLGLVPREPRRFVGINPPSTRSSRSSWLIVEQIQSPWIQPGGRPDLDEDPPRLVLFPFAFAVAFFARSNATVFSFPKAADRVRARLRRRERKRAQQRNLRKKKENEGTLFKSPVRCLL